VERVNVIKILIAVVKDILFNNKIADAEERLYFGDEYDSKEE
jgi:hypothetical protein